MLMFLQNNLGTIAAAAAVVFIVFLSIRRMVLDKKAGIGICGQKCANCANAGHCETQSQTADSCGGACSECKYSASCHKQ